MVDQSIIDRIQLMLATRRVGIVIPRQSPQEAYAAGLGLAISLKKLSTSIQVFAEDSDFQNDGILNHLPGIELVTSTPPNSEFKISVFGMTGATVKKVGYFLEGDEFQVMVSTGDPIQSNLSSEVTPIQNGWDVSFILVSQSVSLINLQNLMKILPGEKIILTNAELPSQVTLISDTKATSISQLVFGFMGVMGIYPTLESATCLMYGLGVTQAEPEV